MRGPRFESLDELDFLGEHGLLAFELRLALFLSERTLLFVEIEIARICDKRSAVDLHDLTDDTIHKGAIVRGH